MRGIYKTRKIDLELNFGLRAKIFKPLHAPRFKTDLGYFSSSQWSQKSIMLDVTWPDGCCVEVGFASFLFD